MFHIVVVDRSAEQRIRLVNELSAHFARQGLAEALVPSISLRPIAPEELCVAEPPDLLIVGASVISPHMNEVRSIRADFPSAGLFLFAEPSWPTIERTELAARLGVDQIVTADEPMLSVVRRIVMRVQRALPTHRGRLVLVVGGKGGGGVTSVAAGFAEACSERCSRVALVDCDWETQELSRFLCKAPSLNHSLHEFLRTPSFRLTCEVDQLLVPVWDEDLSLLLLPPPPNNPAFASGGRAILSGFHDLFQRLDGAFDLTVVDVGRAHGPVLDLMCKLADTVLFVLSSDPAAICSGIERIFSLRQKLGQETKLRVLQNLATGHHSVLSSLRKEFVRASGVSKDQLLTTVIPWSRRGARWPMSGQTIFSLGGRAMDCAFREVVDAVLNRAHRQTAWATLCARLGLGLLTRPAPMSDSATGLSGTTSDSGRGTKLMLPQGALTMP